MEHKKIKSLGMNKKSKYGIYKKQKKIVAICDLHGDMLKLLSVLISSKLIKKKNPYQKCILVKDYSINNWIWTGENTYLVQVGDIFDGGGRKEIDTFKDYEVEIYKFLIGLKKLALEKGGNVILVIGNHELMNFDHNFNYVQESAMKKCLVLKNKDFNYISLNKPCNHRRKLFEIPNGPLAKSMYHHMKGVVKIASSYSIKTMNKLLRLYLANKLNKKAYNKFKHIYKDKNAVVWYRGYVQNPTTCNDFYKTLDILSADRMIVGHTVQNTGIREYCDDKALYADKVLYAIDVGLSRAFTTKIQCQYLVIENDNNISKRICDVIYEC